MAADTPSAAAVGPVPFKDIDVDGDQQATLFPEQPPKELADLADMVSSLPTKMDVCPPVRIFSCQGVWLTENWVAAAIALQRRFVHRPDDVIVASQPPQHNALAFATMARRAHPPTTASHPLRRLNPHQCLPFFESLFMSRGEAVLDALPSPWLMNTHMPLSMLPSAATTGSGHHQGCKVIYICREPKDMVVSMWHFLCRIDDPVPDMTFAQVFESFCNGARLYGPFWDHILGYWHASAARRDNVLFLRYEDLLRDPAGNVRKLARFVGLPFSKAEEEAGVVDSIVELCSLNNMRNIEANKTGYMDPRLKIPRDALFRKGIIGDWANYMTPDMARRLDDIVADKLGSAGLTF
uniref:Sulfotransferase n=1 Tax=Oryza barthii TaxID=65489 RepID=A0A0D3GEY3_9ORYZ